MENALCTTEKCDKVEIWSVATEEKVKILEQILKLPDYPVHVPPNFSNERVQL